MVHYFYVKRHDDSLIPSTLGVDFTPLMLTIADKKKYVSIIFAHSTNVQSFNKIGESRKGRFTCKRNNKNNHNYDENCLGL